MHYAYLGPEGTFTEAALRMLPEVEGSACSPFPTVEAALEAVRDGMADAAMVPLENSVEGGVPATMTALASGSSLHIVAEVHQRVEFALMARPGMRTNAVGRVVTHPHAHAQCRTWLQQWLPTAEIAFTPSTAAAARDVGGADDAAAAIAAPTAAQRYGLEVLASDIGRDGNAVTRFVLVRRPGPLGPRTGADRTSIMALPGDGGGDAIGEVLDELASRKVRAKQIHPRSYGRGSSPFIVDCEGHAFDPVLRDALITLRERGTKVRFLGSYPRRQ